MTITHILLLLLIPTFVYLLIVFLIVPIIDKHIWKFTPVYNWEKPTCDFGTWNGIGIVLIGFGFRKDYLNDSEVKYAFLSFLIPLIPIGCYRVSKLGSDSFGGGYIQETTTTYKIYGTEEWRIHEIIISYITIVCGVVFVILLINLIILLYDIIHKS